MIKCVGISKSLLKFNRFRKMILTKLEFFSMLNCVDIDYLVVLVQNFKGAYKCFQRKS
jgi:hypothetical protein